MNLLYKRFHTVLDIAIEDPWPLIDPKVYKKRSGVLSQEDSFPANLRTQILVVQL